MTVKSGNVRPADRARAAEARCSTCALSVIVPAYNESGNILPLCEAMLPVLDAMAVEYEVIFVNDGSSDSSLLEMKQAASGRPRVKVIDLRRNYGQTAAIMAGIDHAQGDIIVLIDADMQNDPGDIPILFDKLSEGFDVVSGWRRKRKDAVVRRTLVSRIANRLISRISGVRLHDYGCTLKAYRREVLENVRLYGEMHRFIPIYASWLGAKVVEIPVRHHPRRVGRSKYGLERTFKVLLDLIVVKFLDRHLVKPIYVFGGFGILSLLMSMVFGSYMLFLKIVRDVSMIETPLPLLSAITFLVGIMSILMGLLAEIMVRTYFESQKRTPYTVRDRVNFDGAG